MRFRIFNSCILVLLFFLSSCYKGKGNTQQNEDLSPADMEKFIELFETMNEPLNNLAEIKKSLFDNVQSLSDLKNALNAKNKGKNLLQILTVGPMDENKAKFISTLITPLFSLTKAEASKKGESDDKAKSEAQKAVDLALSAKADSGQTLMKEIFLNIDHILETSNEEDTKYYANALALSAMIEDCSPNFIKENIGFKAALNEGLNINTAFDVAALAILRGTQYDTAALEAFSNLIDAAFLFDPAESQASLRGIAVAIFKKYKNPLGRESIANTYKTQAENRRELLKNAFTEVANKKVVAHMIPIVLKQLFP